MTVIKKGKLSFWGILDFSINQGWWIGTTCGDFLVVVQLILSNYQKIGWLVQIRQPW